MHWRTSVGRRRSNGRRGSECFERPTLTRTVVAGFFVCRWHQILAEPWIGARHIGFRQTILAADDIGALRAGSGLVERDHAVGTLTAEAAIGRNDEVLDVDYVFMRFRLASGPSFEQELECIRRFGAEVIPKVRTSSPV